MYPRYLAEEVTASLAHSPVVALLGPRPVGNTTLALTIAETLPAVYLDLEAPAVQARLADPAAYLAGQQGRLVILDEVQRMPEIFGVLRGIVDAGRRRGRRRRWRRAGRGSAAASRRPRC